jgi:ParB-like chromosome segregation protein Spo0J
MASKKDLFKKKAQELTTIHNIAKPTALGAFNDIERVKSNIQILPELRAFIRPLTDEQFLQLEQNILAHGCQDALVLWETSNYELGRGEDELSIYVLVDGHNRYQICKKHGIDFKIMLKTFESIETVKEYMIDLQIGRRNLTLEEESYYRGLKYNAQKGKRGIAMQLAQEGRGEETVNIAENLAEQFNVTSRTIKNDGKYAQGLNKLAPELRNEVLQGKSKISKKEIQELADSDVEDNSIQSLNEVESKSIPEKEAKPTSKKDTLIKEIKKLSENLKTKKNCDLLIEKVSFLKELI